MALAVDKNMTQQVTEGTSEGTVTNAKGSDRNNQEAFLYCEGNRAMELKRLPREVVEFPSLEIFKSHLDCVSGCRYPCLSKEVGPDDFQGSYSTSTIP